MHCFDYCPDDCPGHVEEDLLDEAYRAEPADMAEREWLS